MTTREQLGLNANWIPMDSSKSGDSIQEQVDSLKRIVKSNSDKINELSSSGLSESFLDYTIDNAEVKFEILASNNGGYKLLISTDSTGIDFKFNLSYESTVNSVSLNSDSPVEVKLPEVIVESLKEFNAHFYRKVIKVSDVKIKKTRTFGEVIWSATVKNVGIGTSTSGLYYTDFYMLSSTKQNLIGLSNSFNLYLFCLVCGDKEYKSISTSSRINLSNPVDSITQAYDEQYALPSSSLANQFIAIKTLNNNNESSISVFSNYTDTNGMKTESGLKSFKILEFNQVFSDSESEMFNVHSFSITARTINDIINPVLVSEKNMKRYGSRLDQTGHPIYVYGRTQGYSDSVVYAYFTDLSKWLLYSYHDGGGFMKNARKLAPYHKAEYLRPIIMGDGVISNYTNTANVSSSGDISYSSINYNVMYVTGENPRIPVGATLEELKSGKVIECYVLNYNLILKSKLNDLGIYSLYNFLENYIDASTGEYKANTRLDDNLKQDKICVKQVIKWDSDSQKVIASGEKVTLRDVFVNFANKSNEYLIKYPNEGSIKYDEKLTNLKSKLSDLNSNVQRLSLDSNLSTLNYMKSSLEGIVNDTSFDSKDNKASYLIAYGISNDTRINLNTKNLFSSISDLPTKYSKLKTYSFTTSQEITISDSTTRGDLRRYLDGVNEAISVINLVKEYLSELDIDSLLQDLNCY